MKKVVSSFLVIFSFCISSVYGGYGARAQAAESPMAFYSHWVLEYFQYQWDSVGNGSVSIRAGYYRENPAVPFKGNIIYLEGFADSMLNHAPLFGNLSDAGYRVIAFDYMGQGGSEGSMGNTRILDVASTGAEISNLAAIVWQKYHRNDPSHARKIVLGWSTGGLAGYEMAAHGEAGAVILIAPGIHPNLLVGDMEIVTLKTLTSARYESGTDPHMDPISPKSPVLAPGFAVNLIATANLSHDWTIPREVPGLVLLSGVDDSYVDSVENLKTLRKNAHHFQIGLYPESLHEIDNEVEPIRKAATERILKFLKSIEMVSSGFQKK